MEKRDKHKQTRKNGEDKTMDITENKEYNPPKREKKTQEYTKNTNKKTQTTISI